MIASIVAASIYQTGQASASLSFDIPIKWGERRLVTNAIWFKSFTRSKAV